MAALLGSFFVSFFVRVGNFILVEEGGVRVNSFSSFLCWRGRQSQITGRTTFGLLDLFFSAAGFFLGCEFWGVGNFKLWEEDLWYSKFWFSWQLGFPLVFA
jgi:hypothetical protein